MKEFEKSLGKSGDALVAEVRGKSKAAGGLAEWMLSMDKCYDIFKEVEPKKEKAKRLED